MEIERKYTIKKLPKDLDKYPCHVIEQGYLCTSPVVRVRREDERYYMTYKGSGMMVREEYNMPLTKSAYEHLIQKADGNIISKKRYVIPIEHPKFEESYMSFTTPKLNIELDIFSAPSDSLIMAEVEFSNEEMANAFIAPEWFDTDVTNNPAYHNSNMSKNK